MGRSELIVNDLRFTMYFCTMKMLDVMSTMSAAIAAAKFAWSPTSLMNSE